MFIRKQNDKYKIDSCFLPPLLILICYFEDDISKFMVLMHYSHAHFLVCIIVKKRLAG